MGDEIVILCTSMPPHVAGLLYFSTASTPKPKYQVLFPVLLLTTASTLPQSDMINSPLLCVLLSLA